MSEAELVRLREGFGRGSSSFGGEYSSIEGECWWALSGIPHPDYNTALVYDGDVVDHARNILARISAATTPALLMLAGHGLGAAQVLSEAGWVCVAAMPLMVGRAENLWDPEGVSARLLTPADANEARRVFSASFALPDSVAAQIYSDDIFAASGVSVFGVDGDEGRLSAVTLMKKDGDIFSSWMLATDPACRRRGVAAGLMSAVLESATSHGPEAHLIGLATAPAEALYRRKGHVEPCEYWQVWSRPRWMLANI